MAVVRILVVDDFRLWHNAVTTILGANPELRVISTALSGREALGKVERLAPDLVLLDVEMPEMDGIQVAYQIRRVAPATRIIFLSGTDSMEIIERAMEAGACGYVHKMNARFNLIPAIQAAMTR